MGVTVELSAVSYKYSCQSCRCDPGLEVDEDFEEWWKAFSYLGISLVTGIVLLVNGWILNAGSVFENRAFSNFIKKQMNQVKLRPSVGAH